MIKQTYHDVNQALGNIVKVTPTSKVVADFSMFLVQNDETVDGVLERSRGGDEIDFPQSVVDFFAGDIGQPHGGFPEELQRAVLRGREPRTQRPGIDLPDYDWSVAGQELEEQLGRTPSEQEQISFALYPKVFSEFAGRIEEFGEYRILDTVTFLYGLELNEERVVRLEEGKDLVVKLLTIGSPDADGMRELYFELNGQPRQVKVRDHSVTTETTARPKADKRNPAHVGASMPGAILSVEVSAGDAVSKGDVLLKAEAMKMETSVTSPRDGVVARVEVSVGDRVAAGDLLVVLEA